MEKILRRTALANSQAKRKARILTEKETARDRAQHRAATGAILRENGRAIRQARKNRWEDWELGSIAPWRDSSATSASSMVPHGSWNLRIATPPKLPEANRVKDWFIREGDRVCVVEGGEHVKGRIGKVKRVEKESDVLYVEGVNLVDLRIPQAMQQNSGIPIHSTERPLPLSSVRLVYPLPDAKTGVPRDCILDNLVKRETRFDVYENETVWSRVLLPQNIRIPWPAKDETTKQDEICDTLRIDVENATFLPTLLRPPMPLGVIDELRNKYSKFRDRHDDDWIATKIAEDEQMKEVNNLGEKVRPRGARNIARVHGSSLGGNFMASRTPPKLSDQTLETLGAYMAAKRFGKNGKNSGSVDSPTYIPHRTDEFQDGTP